MAEKYKTPDYTRRAIAEYKKRNKVLSVTVSLEIYERLTAAGITAKDIKPLLMAELEKRENSKQ